MRMKEGESQTREQGKGGKKGSAQRAAEFVLSAVPVLIHI